MEGRGQCVNGARAMGGHERRSAWMHVHTHQYCLPACLPACQPAPSLPNVPPPELRQHPFGPVPKLLPHKGHGVVEVGQAAQVAVPLLDEGWVLLGDLAVGPAACGSGGGTSGTCGGVQHSGAASVQHPKGADAYGKGPPGHLLPLLCATQPAHRPRTPHPPPC